MAQQPPDRSGPTRDGDRERRARADDRPCPPGAERWHRHHPAALVDPRLAGQHATCLDLDEDRQHRDDGEQGHQRDQCDEHLDQPLERSHGQPRTPAVQVHDRDAVDQLAWVPGVRPHRGEPGRHGVDVGGCGEQPLDGGGLLVACRAREGDHDRVDVGLCHRPGQGRDWSEQGKGEPAGLVEGAGRAGADEADRPQTQLGPGEQRERDPPGGRAGADDHHGPPEPATSTQHVGHAVDQGVREHQAGQGKHAERHSGRAGADQDRGRGGRRHEQPGQVLDDGEHQPGPVQVCRPRDQYGDRGGDQGRGRVVGRHQAREDDGGRVGEGQHWSDRAEPRHPSAHACNHRPSPQDQLCGRTPL